MRSIGAVLLATLLVGSTFGDGGKDARGGATLKHVAGRWFVLEGDFTIEDLHKLGIRSVKVRKNGEQPIRAGGPDGTQGVLLYRSAGFIDPFSENYGDTNGDGTQDLRVTYNANEITIQSQNLPNHPTGTFPNSANPNSIQVKNFTFHIPTNPAPAALPTSTPLGPCDVALNGVVFYNPYSMEGTVAISGMGEEWFDSCCGHPDQTGTYHYHKFPRCVKSPFTERGDDHSPIVGFAWDGYPIHGPYESKGVFAKDLTGAAALDALNGHSDPERGYHYHVSATFPYIIGGYRGTPDTRNNNMLSIGDNNIPTGIVPTGDSPYDDAVLSVLPAQANAGETVVISISLATSGVTPPIPPSTPLVVSVGPYVGTSIVRTGSTVTASITIPEDASLNLFDVHLEFAPPMGTNRLVYRKSDAFLAVPLAAASVGGMWLLY